MTKYIRGLLAGAMLSLLLFVSVSAEDKPAGGVESGIPAGDGAVIFPLEGQLEQTMVMRLTRAVDLALSHKARYLVVEVNTPGGEMTLMEQLRDLLFDAYQKSKLETVAYVNNDADSAGALIVMACRQVYMSPLAHIGSATPVAINPLAPLMPMLPGGQSQGEDDMMRKIKSRARAVFRATAIETGRNPDLAEAMVDPDIELVLALVDNEEQVVTRQKLTDLKARLGENKVVEYSIVCAKGELLNMTAREALSWGFIEGIPDSREALFRSFLNVDPARVLTVQPSWSESLVDFLDSIHFLLLIAGLILLYIEFQSPGFGVPGILGLACLALLFFGKYMVGLAEFTEILMVVAGICLVVVEVFILPGFLVFGILGGILVLAGLVLSFQPFVYPQGPWQMDLFMDNVLYVFLSVIAALLWIVVVSRFLPRASLFKRFVLESASPPGTLHGSAAALDEVKPGLKITEGEKGVAQSTLRPAGKVIIQDTLIDAQTEGEFIDAGEEVTVVRVTGPFVFVRKSKEPPH